MLVAFLSRASQQKIRSNQHQIRCDKNLIRDSFYGVCRQATITGLAFLLQMNITLKDAEKQKVTKHLAPDNINVIHQQYPGLSKSL